MKRSAKLVVLVITLLAASSSATAQTVAQHPRVKQALKLLKVWLDAQRDYDQIPSISAGVVYDQNLLWSESFGYADVEHKIPATPQTRYSICSISKLFTSIAVMQLRDAGKLRLDDPVGAHLPWFHLKTTQGEGDVTIEGLLTHASGLPQEPDSPYWSGPDFAMPTREEII